MILQLSVQIFCVAVYTRTVLDPSSAHPPSVLSLKDCGVTNRQADYFLIMMESTPVVPWL